MCTWQATKIWTDLESTRKKLAHAEAVYEQSKTRPMHKTGKFGLYGTKVDSIDYYKEQMEKLEPLLKDEQSLARSKSQQGAAIVIFNNRAAAAAAGQVPPLSILYVMCVQFFYGNTVT